MLWCYSGAVYHRIQKGVNVVVLWLCRLPPYAEWGEWCGVIVVLFTTIFIRG